MFLNKFVRATSSRARKALSVATILAFVAAGMQAPAAQAATATINNVSFKAPVFDSYNHSTGGGAWNDGSVTYDKGELLGTNYKCGDIATFLLELNTSATPTKQPAPYKAEIRLSYTWDATGQSGVSLTPLLDTSHLKVNTGQILKTYNGANTVLGTGSGGTDGGMNTAGAQASVATTPAPQRVDTGTEFTTGSTSDVIFTVQGIQASANIIVRSDAIVHCKPGASPTGNMQASLMYVNVTYPGAAEAVSAGNQTVNFRGVGNLAGLGNSLTVIKTINTAQANDCSTSISAVTFASAPQTVIYCYTVTNTGNTDITNVVLTDDNAGQASSTTIPLTVGNATATSPITLLIGQTATGIYSFTYQSTGVYTNTATVTSSAPTATATATATLTSSAPSFSIQKAQTSPNPSNVGDVITYTITNNFTNGGGTASVTDSNASSLTCLTNPTVTAPAGTYGVTVSSINIPGTGSSTNVSFTCTATHIVNQTDVSAGLVLNSATLTKTGNGGGTVTSNTVKTPIPVRALTYQISIEKTQTSTLKPSAAGDLITYQLLVTNIGTGSLTNVYLGENLTNTTISGCAYVGGGNITTAPVSLATALATLASGASFTCNATHTVQSAELGTTVNNTATVNATGNGTPITPVVSNQVSTPTGAQPLLKVLKIQATGAAPAHVGSILTYGISVSNAGNVAITGVNVTDPNAVLSNCKVGTTPWVQGSTLLVGQVIDCDASHAVTAADLTAGSVLNVAYATGTYGSTPLSAQSDNVRSFGALSIVKTRTDSNATLILGSIITYDITVTNTGDINLTNVQITDANATPPCSVVATLAVGASTVCSVSHTVTSTDVSNHQVLNTASVTTDQTDAINSNEVLALITESGSHITIVKTRTSAAQVTAVGQTITYSITATNTGSTTLTNVQIADAYATLGTCAPVASLAPLATVTCTASHIVVDADATAGHYDNVATVTTNENSNGTSNLSTSNHVDTPIIIPGLTIVKSRVGNTALTAENDVVTYQIVITNTGNLPLTNAQLADANAVLGACTDNLSHVVTWPTTLGIGGSITCAATHSVTASEVTARQVLNTATVTTTEIPSTDSNQVVTPVTPPVVGTPLASLNIVKALTGIAPTKVGQSVSYTITVTNNGDVLLGGVNVSDANAVLGACSVALPATLAVGASLTCAATHVVTDADMAAGKVDNVAVASATTGSLSRSSNVVTVPLNPAPALSIVKNLAGTAPSKVGETINYSIVVTNTGNVTVSALTVADANATLGTCTPATPATLAPGASVTCAATHVITVADMLAGKVDNVATAQGTALGAPVAGSSSQSNSPAALNVTSNVVTVPLAYAPAISITKHVTGSLPTTIGGFLHYIIVVVNTGNVALHDVAIADGNATITSCSVDMPVAELAVGDRVTCFAKHALTEADALAGKVVNVASVTTKENATASSGSDATTGASGGDPATVNKSNEVVTPIVFEKQSIGKGTKSGTIVLKLGGTALKNPKLKQLAFTGGEEPATSDYGFFLALLALIAAAFGARRWAKR